MSKHEHAASGRKLLPRARVALGAAALLAASVILAGCYQVRDDGTEIASSGPTPTPAANAPAGGSSAPSDAATRGAAQPPVTGAGAPAANGALKSDVLPQAVMEAQVQTLDGRPFRLADYKGKIVVLDIWATWCGPCRNMIPHLVETQNEFGPKGVEVIGLTTEEPATDEAKVRAFAREFKINYKLGWADDQFILALLGPRFSIPQTFVIGRDGRLYYHAAGYSAQVPLAVNQIIERLEAGD